MISTWIQSAPPRSTRSTSWPSTEKSADKMEGAILIIVLVSSCKLVWHRACRGRLPFAPVPRFGTRGRRAAYTYSSSENPSERRRPPAFVRHRIDLGRLSLLFIILRLSPTRQPHLLFYMGNT